MNKDDFRRSYDEIDYTDEFRTTMRKKLSEPSTIKQTSNEYINTVEGVDTMKRNRILHTVTTIAACGVLVTAGGAIGFAIKGASGQDSKPITSSQSPSVSTSDTSHTETSTTSTFIFMIIDLSSSFAKRP